MNFDFNDEQKMLKKGARDFFEKECPKSLVRQMAEDEKGNPAEFMAKDGTTRLAGLDVPGEVRRQRREHDRPDRAGRRNGPCLFTRSFLLHRSAWRAFYSE